MDYNGLGKLKILRKRLDNYMDQKYTSWFGYELPPEVVKDINKIDKYAYRNSCIHFDTLYFWENKFKPVYEKLADRFLKNNRNVYFGVHPDKLFHIMRAMRGTLECTNMPVIPRKELKGKIKLNRGLTTACFDELFPAAYVSRVTNNLDSTLLESNIDPVFSVSASTVRCRTLKDDFTMEIGIDDLESILGEEDRISLRERGYMKGNGLETNKKITLSYRLEGVKGSLKEIPRVKMN